MVMQLIPLTALAIAAFMQAEVGSQTDRPAMAVPPARQANHVGIIEVHGPIDAMTRESVKRRAEDAVRDGVDLIVLELDTPGGDLEATLDICNFIKQEVPVRTRAWVRPEAYSAGVIIALATDGILMSPGSRMGDAAPIRGIPVAGMLQMPATERAKIEAPLLAEVVDSARRNGYDEKLVQSMVSVRFALWELERIKDAEGTGRLFADANEYQRIYGEAPPVDRGRGSEPTVPSNTPPLSSESEESVSLLQDISSERPRLGPEDASEWRLRNQVVGEEELLVVDSSDAIRMGLCRKIVPDESALALWFGATRTTRYQESWLESAVRLLTSWPIQAILIGIVIIGFFLEIAAPGTSIFGGAALLALAFLIGSPMMIGMIEWWDVTLVLGGITLIGIEIVLLPGVGVAGILGTISLMVGLVGVMVTADMGTAEANNQITVAVVAILSALMLGGIGSWWLARRSGGFWLLQRLVLDSQSGAPISVGTPEPEKPALAGLTGRAATDLRPSGRIEVDGVLHSARSTTGWLDQGTPVRVLGEFGGEWNVEPLTGTNVTGNPGSKGDT
jgi:membrane-bound serine protease (ClpP class)